MADGEWVQRIEFTSPDPAETNAATPRGRWRHAGLDSLLTQPDARAKLGTAARSADVVVATNAAIGLARLGEPSALARLVKSAHDSSLKLPMRGAAIEAIGGLATPKADNALEELLAGFGDYRGDAKVRYLPELHVDLVRAVAGRDPPRHAQALHVALASPAAAVRLEAVKAYAKFRGPLPRELVECTADAASSVRAAAIGALAAAQHDEAEACALRGLNDYDLSVRLAAIEALGGLRGSDNTSRLLALAEDSADTIRAAAVKALAHCGESAAVAQAAKDASWRVRSAVAESLHIVPGDERVPLARALLADASLEVQRRMVRALAAWPLEEAAPLLLTAIDGPTAATRRDAAGQLQERWPAAADLSPQAPPERLAAEAARLRELWQHRPAFQGRPENATALAGRRTGQANPSADAATLQRTMESIEQLAADSLQDRRAAAHWLVGEHRETTLPDPAVQRLAELAEREGDALVWNELLVLIHHDGRAPAIDIAAIAASHPSADIRRRACAYFADHPGPRAADVLKNCTSDEDATVVREALRALAKQRHVPDVGSLESLLITADSGVRIEAATALARHGSPAGVRALLRLTHHQDPVIRRQAAAALGQAFSTAENAADRNAGQQFDASPKNRPLDDSLRNAAIGELVRLLDDQGDVRRAALASLQGIVSDPPPPAPDSNEQVRRWKEWHTGRSGGP